ncbi:MAG TPA: ATP-binding protein [Polyangiales bacterium]|nr:ATP-binding protein [Polyangiales bacterium]
MTSSADTKLVDNQLDTAQLIENAPCALIAVDERQKICFANRGAEQLFEYAEGELLGKPIDLLFSCPASAHELWAPGNGRDVSGIRKSGSPVQLEVALAHTDTALGRVAVAAIVEMTERKRREEALTRSNRDLEQFAYIASHDLREPLRMVSSFLSLLVQRYKDQLDKDAQRYIHFAVDGANRMQRLIDGLLAYARVGSQQTTLAAVDSSNTLRAAWLNLSQVVKETGAQLEAEALPVVHADAKLLQQVFQSLLDNSLKFRHEQPPHIQVSARPNGNSATISFKDNGIGFDMKHRDKVFEVFRRLHEIGKYEGAGMGLAIAKRIVEMHHGSLDVEAAPNAGCTFHVTLPLHHQH